MAKKNTKETEVSTVETSNEENVTVETSKAGDKKEVEKPKQELPKRIQEYAKAYPQNKMFFETSDKMIFLEQDEQEASEHQYIVDDTKKHKSYKID